MHILPHHAHFAKYDNSAEQGPWLMLFNGAVKADLRSLQSCVLTCHKCAILGTGIRSHLCHYSPCTGKLKAGCPKPSRNWCIQGQGADNQLIVSPRPRAPCPMLENLVCSPATHMVSLRFSMQRDISLVAGMC